MGNFIPSELAVKLKEKGFTCEHPFAMYDAVGIFYALYTSAGSIECYDYWDFDEHDYIAPTISQVLEWLREEKNIHLYTDIDNEGWFFEIKCLKTRFMVNTDFFKRYSTHELADLAGIEYVIDNLI